METEKGVELRGAERVVRNPLLSERDGNIVVKKTYRESQLPSETHYSLKEMETLFSKTYG